MMQKRDVSEVKDKDAFVKKNMPTCQEALLCSESSKKGR